MSAVKCVAMLVRFRAYHTSAADSKLFPIFAQDRAAEPVGDLHGVGQVNEEEQEGQQWFRARVSTSWCQSGAGRYNAEACSFCFLCRSTP